MATLKDHQKAMVDLLANGSAIPASAARLAHALHDVLALMVERDSGPRGSRVSEHVGGTIEDVRFAADLDAQFEDSPTPEPLAEWLRGQIHQTPALLRAKVAAVTNQRDELKARCELLEAEVVKRDEIIDELKSRLLGAPVTYCGFPKIVDLRECRELAVIPLQHIDHIIARIGTMTGVEQGEIAKVVGAIVAISPKP